MAPIPATVEKPWAGETEKKFESKAYSEYYDPCQEMATRSLKCLHRNGGNREMCTDYFQAYRDCKKKWLDERKEAKRKAAWGWTSSSNDEKKAEAEEKK